MGPAILPEEEIKRLFAIDDLEILDRLLQEDDDQIEPEEIGMNYVGSGAFGIVMAHPDRPDLVIRVSQYNDGWIAYASGEGQSPLRPRVREMAWTGGAWVSIVERLVEPDYEETRDFLKRFDAANDQKLKASACPEMRRFIEEVEAEGLYLDDTEIRNVLKRESDGRLVMNDPVMEMTWAQMQSLQSRFSIESEEDFDLTP